MEAAKTRPAIPRALSPLYLSFREPHAHWPSFSFPFLFAGGVFVSFLAYALRTELRVNLFASFVWAYGSFLGFCVSVVAASPRFFLLYCF